jgi:cytochrome c553
MYEKVRHRLMHPKPMNNDARNHTPLILTLLMLLAISALPRLAIAEQANAAYQGECAACHIAYPARLMSASAWKNVLGNLGSHFGVDATVGEPSQKEILQYLTRNAARSFWGDEEVPAQNRITQTRWFHRKHGAIPAEVWTRDSVHSASNCVACHAEAGQADFDDDNVKIPR